VFGTQEGVGKPSATAKGKTGTWGDPPPNGSRSLLSNQVFAQSVTNAKPAPSAGCRTALQMEKSLPTIVVGVSDTACLGDQVPGGTCYAAMTTDGRSAGDL